METLRNVARRGARCAVGAAAVSALSLAPTGVQAAVPPVNPADMGKGDWIWLIPSAQTALGVSSVQGVIDYEKNKGMKWIIVKCADKGTWMSQFNTDLITRAHTAGLQIFGYQRCNGDNVTAEINAGKQCLATAADGYIIDAEIEYEGKNSQAVTMMTSLRATYPTKFIAHAPLPYIDYHTAFPYVTFGKYCDAVMPQCYWNAIGVSPTVMVTDLNTQWNKWHTTWTGQGNGSAIKPIVPVGQSYDAAPASEMTTFANTIKTTANPATVGGYKGISFWSCQHRTASQWTALGAITIGGGTIPPGTAFIVDNSNAGFTASANWSTGTSAADKYGTNYRYRNTQSIGDAAQWNISVPATGNYDVSVWWSQGTNRSATAPYVSTNGATVSVNQQTSGGVWNSLGVYAVSAGTANVKLSCWTTTGFIVLGDAVKLTKQ